MRTRETIEAQATEQSPENTPKTKRKDKRGDVTRIAKWQWQPGQSGNPGGRPKNDMAQVIAKAVFENNPEMLYKAYAKALGKGQAFAFQVLSDRAYGKLKEKLELSGTDEIANLLEKARQRSKK